MKFKRKEMLKKSKLTSLIDNDLGGPQSFEQDGYFDLPRYIREKNEVSQALEFKLNLISAGRKEEAKQDGVTIQQLIDMQRELNKCKPKHCKNLKSKIDVLNSQRSLMTNG